MASFPPLDDKSRSSQTRRWCQRIPLPSFAMCCATTLGILALYLIWMHLDAQYSGVLHLAKWQMGVFAYETNPFTDYLMERVRGRDRLGPRLMLFVALAGVAIIAAMGVMVHFTRRGTIRRMLAIVCIVSVWLAFWSSYDRLYEFAAVRHARRELPRFRAVAAELSRHWPTEHGTLDDAGKYYAYPDEHPNLLAFYQRRGYQRRLDFGHLIERSDEEALRFTVNGPAEYQIELHPSGSEPKSYTSGLGSPLTMRSAIPLDEDGWWLVRYR